MPNNDVEPGRVDDPRPGSSPVAFTNPSDQDIVEWLPRRVADRRIRYGTDPLQFGDLRLPAGPVPDGGHPVAVLLHGGGYSANWNLDHGARLAERLTDACGIATWNLEYRRPGQRGAGWPGTWLDIAAGIDQLRLLQGAGRPAGGSGAAPGADPAGCPVDLGRVIAVGHSAGATFAAWAATRGSLEPSSELHAARPVELAGVVLLAGILDLRSMLQDRDDPPRNLMGILTADDGDTLAEMLGRCPEVSPLEIRSRIPVAQRLIVGSGDEPVMVEQTRTYAEALDRDGRPATLEVLDGANHFDLIDPTGGAWPVVAGSCASLLGLDLPAQALVPADAGA